MTYLLIKHPGKTECKQAKTKMHPQLLTYPQLPAYRMTMNDLNVEPEANTVVVTCPPPETYPHLEAYPPPETYPPLEGE